MQLDFNSYLMGLIDGEGYFAIYERKGSKGFNAAFAITNTNREVLEMIQKHLKVGHIVALHMDKYNPKWKCGYQFKVTHYRELQRVVDLIDRYGLFIKKEEFENFKRKLASWKAQPKLSKHEIEELIRLRKEGKTISQLAEYFGKNPTSIKRALWKLGLKSSKGWRGRKMLLNI